MSLIDEALKRAQSAGQAGEGQPGDRPWVPTPMPDEGLARRWVLRRAAGATLLAIAAAGAAYWFFLRSTSGVPVSRARSAAPPLAPKAAPMASAAVPTALPVSVVPTPPRARPGVAGPASPAQAPHEDLGGRVEEAPAVEAPAPRPQRLVSGKTYSGVVALPEGPRIELGGIVWSETEPRALLNDRILGVGGYVEGFTVESIETERVELRRDDVRIFLSVK